MKIKDNLDIGTDDFWYDLTDGGYLKPEDILEREEDIEKVNEAIRILQLFKKSCEDKIPNFIQ